METELESMVVRLLGDLGSYTQMMTEAQAQTKQAMAQVESSLKQTEETAKATMAGTAAAVTTALAAFKAKEFLQGALNSFVELEQNQLRLRAAIRGNGGDVATVLPFYEQFTNELKQTFAVSKGLSMGLLRQAETFGLSGQAAVDAARNAVFLAAAVDGSTASADSYVRVAAALARGDIAQLHHMSRMIPQLRGIKDETQLLAKAQQLLTIGMETAGELSTSTGTMLERLNDGLKRLKSQFGSVVAEAMKPFIAISTEIVNWFTKLGDSVKRVVVTLALITAAVLSIGPAWAFVTSIVMPAVSLIVSGFGLISTLVGAIFSPLGLIIIPIVAAGVAVWAWVRSVGGLTEAWTILKEKALAFWSWLLPIATAYLGYLSALWDGVKYVVAAVWDFIKGVISSFWNWVKGIWGSMFGESSMTWTKIRDQIVDSLLFGEFALRNFGEVASFVWTSMKLGAVVAFNSITYFFTGVLPALLRWFADNWMEVFETAFSFVSNGVRNMFGNVVRVAESIPDIIAGRANWDQIWRPITEGARITIRELPRIPAREIGPVEEQLQKEWEAQRDKLQSSFQDFRAKRLAEMGLGEEAIKKAGTVGGVMGNQLKKEFKEAGKLDAVDFFSSEAAARIQDYLDRIRSARGTPGTPVPGGGGGGGTLPITPSLPGLGTPASGPGSTPGTTPIPTDPTRDRIISILTAHTGLLQKIADKEPVIVVGEELLL